MPGLNGFETCRRLRDMGRGDPLNRRLATVPIVFLTARKTIEDVREGMAAGGNDFIVKPFDPTALVTRILHWIIRGTSAPRSQVPGSQE
jgi:DNA-binding response OmpR family regulator